MLRLRVAERTVHLHVYSPGSAEINRFLVFRDRLRSNPNDRSSYETVKRTLAQRTWPTAQHYADAKSEIVEAIIERARG